jgi:GNAT superfamily N-acetyltransferase
MSGPRLRECRKEQLTAVAELHRRRLHIEEPFFDRCSMISDLEASPWTWCIDGEPQTGTIAATATLWRDTDIPAGWVHHCSAGDGDHGAIGEIALSVEKLSRDQGWALTAVRIFGPDGCAEPLLDRGWSLGPVDVVRRLEGGAGPPAVPGVRIRSGGLADIDLLIKGAARSLRNGCSEAERAYASALDPDKAAAALLCEALDRDALILVAETDRSPAGPAGFALLDLVQMPGQYRRGSAFLHDVHVETTHAGCGIGGTLVHAACEAARSRGARHIYATVMHAEPSAAAAILGSVTAQGWSAEGRTFFYSAANAS